MSSTPDQSAQQPARDAAAPAPADDARDLVDQLKAAGPSPHAGEEATAPADRGAPSPSAPDAKDESLLGAKGDPAEGAD